MIHIDGQWHYTEPRIKVDGKWHGFVRVWQKINGEWVVVQDNYTWSLYELAWEDSRFWGGIER